MRLALTFKYIPLLIIALISVSGCSSSSTSPADDLAEAPDLVSEDPIDELIESTGSDNTAETSSNESSSEPLGNPAAEEPEQVQDTVAVAEVQNEIPEPEITPVDSGSEEMAVTADSPAVQTLPQVDFLLDDVAQPLLVEFASYQSESLALLAGALVDDIRTSSEAELSIDPNSPDSERFNCNAGGTVTVDGMFEGDVATSSGSSTAMLNYLFDQCQHQFTGTRLPEDTYRITGNLLLEGSRGFGRGSLLDLVERWDDVEISLSNGLNYEIDGEVSYGRTVTANVDIESRTANIANYRKFEGDTLVESLENVSFIYNDDRSLGPTAILLDVSGNFTSNLTGNHMVSLLSNPPLTALTDSFDIEGSEPFSGTIEYSSTDGSFLTLTPNPEQVINSGNSLPEYRVDLSYTSPAGERRNNDNIELIDITPIPTTGEISSVSCLLTAVSGEIECSDEPLSLP